MASGSQTWRGNCALLPTAPPKMSRAQRVATGMPHRVAWVRCSKVCGSKILRKVRVPAKLHRINIPAKSITSPMRVVRKALRPASRGEILSGPAYFQNCSVCHRPRGVATSSASG